MKRGKLKEIYLVLSDSDKSSWSKAADYSSCQGLYKYLQNRPDEHAYESLLDSLISTIGPERFNNLVSSSHGPDAITEYIPKNMINWILITNDVAKLQSMKEDLNRALDSQISRIVLTQKFGYLD